MKLMINISNDIILVGAYEKEELVTMFTMKSDVLKTSDEYGRDLLSLLQVKGIDCSSIDGALISSVVVGMDKKLELALLDYFNFEGVKFGPSIDSNIKIFGPSIKTGIKIKVDHPKSLGSDLLIGAYSAYQKYGGDTLIINLGLVSTMVIISKDKELLGGSILAGIDSMIDGLSKNVPNLPMFSFELTRDVINNNTSDALKSGLVFGYVGMLDGMIDYMLEEYDQPLNIILTGQHSFIISKLLKHENILEENLMLDGLNNLYLHNFS